MAETSGDGLFKAGIAAPCIDAAGAVAFGIAALNDEAIHDAVEDQFVIESAFNQLFEIFNALWSFLRKELDLDIAVTLDCKHSDFLAFLGQSKIHDIGRRDNLLVHLIGIISRFKCNCFLFAARKEQHCSAEQYSRSTSEIIFLHTSVLSF